MNVYPFIEAEPADKHNVRRARELMQVSRSGYYQHTRGEQSVRERVDAQLVERITAVYEQSRGTYGAPRVHAELAEAGLRHGRKRVARLMRTAGIAGRCPHRWRTTTIVDPTAATRADLIGRDFGTDPAAVDTRCAATSPTSTPEKAGCTYKPRSSTWPPAVLSARRWPTICAPTWSTPRSRTPSTAAGPSLG